MQSVIESTSGQRGVIVRLDGDERFLNRITAIGLTPGCPVEILRSEKRQPVLLYSRPRYRPFRTAQFGKINAV
jgi:ferrous iron transport protein A